MTRTLASIALLVLIGIQGVAVAALPTLEDALSRLDRAIAHSESDPQAVLESAAVLERVIGAEQIQTAQSELTLGNAYFIGGDLGRAILHYSRGVRTDPTSKELRENLDRARSFVEPTIPDAQRAGRLERAALAWRGWIDREVFWWISVGAFVTLSLSLAARFMSGDRRIPLTLPAACLTVLVLGATPLVSEMALSNDGARAIIVSDGIVGYSGPGTEAFDAVYDDALSAGTDGIVFDHREGWVGLELGNTDRVWVPEHTVERVVPG